MALQLKTSQTYPNPYDGDLTNAYANIKYVGGWDAYSKTITFDLFVYRTQADRDAQKRPITNERFSITGDDYDTYIAAAMSSHSITTAMSIEDALARVAYEYLLAKQVDDPENEGQTIPVIIGTIDMSKWQSDEV